MWNLEDFEKRYYLIWYVENKVIGKLRFFFNVDINYFGIYEDYEVNCGYSNCVIEKYGWYKLIECKFDC